MPCESDGIHQKRPRRGQAGRGYPGGSDGTPLRLGAVARALQLDEAERAHLFDLTRAARPRRPTARQRGKQPVQASVQHILDSAATAAAFVRNGRLDLLAANARPHPAGRSAAVILAQRRVRRSRSRG